MVAQVVGASASIQDITISETERRAFRRLLAKARTEGVRILQDKAGRYWATSTSTPGKFYALTAYSCTCKGFQGHQHCKHLAALLSAMGWLPEETPAPLPPAPTVAEFHPLCRACNGLGEEDYQRRTGPRSFVTAWQTCTRCGGSGKVAA